MPTYKWIIDMTDLQYKFNKIRHITCLRDTEKQFFKTTKVWAAKARRDEVEHRKYYQGFNFGREKTMFQDELGDLEIVYKTALKNYAKEVEDVLPSLLYYMEKFLTVHKHNEAIREKLDILLEKTGRQSQEEDNGGDDE